MTDMQTELERKNALRLSNEESNKLTKECLRTALLLLMESKPLDKITITELVTRSGVSRSAFYRNYSTKDQVLADIADRLCGVIRQSIQDRKSIGVYDWYCNYFSTFQSNPHYVSLLVNNDFAKHFAPAVINLLESSLLKEITYSEAAAIGAITNITKYWIAKGMKESAEEMATLCIDILK